MDKLLRIFEVARIRPKRSPSESLLARIGSNIARAYLDEIEKFMKNPEYDDLVRETIIIGEGNYRIFAVRG